MLPGNTAVAVKKVRAVVRDVWNLLEGVMCSLILLEYVRNRLKDRVRMSLWVVERTVSGQKRKGERSLVDVLTRAMVLPWWVSV